MTWIDHSCIRTFTVGKYVFFVIHPWLTTKKICSENYRRPLSLTITTGHNTNFFVQRNLYRTVSSAIAFIPSGHMTLTDSDATL